LAWDGDRLVGMSGTKVVGSAGSGYIWFAGVDRAYRRRSIALAMKVLTMEWALSRGLVRMTASHNAASQGIVSLNRKLGFKTTAARQYVTRGLWPWMRNT